MKILTFLVTGFVLNCFGGLQAKPFFGEPPSVHHPWAVHDHNRPQPPIVTPGAECGAPPSDAIILFDGTEGSYANWAHERPPEKRKSDWLLIDGTLQSMRGAGYLVTLEEFGDCQLHIEWMAPSEIQGRGQGRGNSGVFLMGMVEVQILDNYENPTYADGTVGSVYGVMPPAVNALRPAGQWQSYDIIFRRPIVRDGVVEDSGSLTVLMNGVVVQDSTPLEGGGGWKFRKPLDRVFPDKGPLKLQDHGNPVRFRNIWYRPLRPRPLDGGSDGRLTAEASMEKRIEIAAGIRKTAQSKEGLDRALLLLESLVYAPDPDARIEADTLIDDYVKSLQATPPSELEKMKQPIMSLDEALTYMSYYGFISDDYFAINSINAVAVGQGWKKASDDN